MDVDCRANSKSKVRRLALSSAPEAADSVPLKAVVDIDAASLHLLRIVSPSLPIGAFSYSRGLEFAVHAGWVPSEPTVRDWILGTLENVFAALDGALFWRMIQALYREDRAGFTYANAWLAASRESREIQLEDRRMGEALISLLRELDVARAQSYAGTELTYPASFAIAARHWDVAPLPALKGLMWTMVEGQVGAAIRLVPVGHIAGQSILIDAVPVIERSAALACTIEDDEIGNLSVAAAMASAWHENQYTRLFRS